MNYPTESGELLVLMKLQTKLYHYHLFDPVYKDNPLTSDIIDRT